MRIVVPGAGIVGVMAAWWLAREGRVVEVVERCTGPAQETSLANGAIVHASSVEPWSGPVVPWRILRWLGREDAPLLLRPEVLPEIWRWGLAFLAACTAERHRASAVRNLALALDSLEDLATIRAETGIAQDGRPRPCSRSGATPRRSRQRGERTRRSRREGCGSSGSIGRNSSREPAPAPVPDRSTCALLFPRDESGDCAAMARGLAEWCAGQGVRFHMDTRVLGFRQAAGRLGAVATDRGELPAEAAVVAAGPWTPALLAPLGLRVPIVPVKGVSLTAPRRLWPEAPRHAILDDAAHYALVPIGERLRLAGSAEFTGFDATPAPARVQALVDRVAALFPAMRAVAAGREAVAWAGLRPMTPRGEPLIGPSRIPGIWLDCGHGHMGWTLSAGSARRLAAQIAGRTPAGPPLG